MNVSLEKAKSQAMEMATDIPIVTLLEIPW